jgi:hypothetical protein
VFQRSSEHDSVISRFLGVFVERGYALTRPAALTSGDATVTFVNATVTPFKDRMARGESLGRTCHHQDCLRANGTHPWLYCFGMVGALADAEHLGAVCADTGAAMAAALGAERAGRLSLLVDARDTDLTAVAGRSGLAVAALAAPRVQTRWTYGDDYPMAGRGMTIVHRHDGPACDDRCGPDCGCGRWQELGNVILVTTPGRDYVEVGVGVESLMSTGHGGDRYLIPEIAEQVRGFVDDGWSAADAGELVNLYRAVDRLIADGAVAAPRGPGSVLRRMMARLAGLHEANERLGTGLLAYAAGRGAGPAVLGALQAEAARRESGRRRRVASAATLLRRHPGTTEEQLRQTYGLSAAELRETYGLTADEPHGVRHG